MANLFNDRNIHIENSRAFGDYWISTNRAHFYSVIVDTDFAIFNVLLSNGMFSTVLFSFHFLLLGEYSSKHVLLYRFVIHCYGGVPAWGLCTIIRMQS